VPHWKRNAALFLTGQAVTLFGSMLVHYAIMWHITLQTDSGLMVALFTAAGTLPMFFISPFAGAWADRHNKKLLINIADASIAAVTLVLAVVFSLGCDWAGLLLVCAIMRAFGQGVQMPAVNALIPEIVPEEHLIRVNGISGSIQSLVMFASPMVGGALLAVAPLQTLLFIDVVTAAIGISILFFFVKTPVRVKKQGSEDAVKTYYHDIKEGLRYIRGHKFVRRFLVYAALFNLMVAPAAILTPLQVTRDWGDGVWRVFGGMSFGAEQRLAAIEVVFSVGMMLGGLVMGTWGGFKNKSRSMALSTCLFGIGTIWLGLLTNFWGYLVCMGLVGLVMSLSQAPMTALIQTNVKPDYMGRVFSVVTMISTLAMPLGMLLWGPLGDVVAIDRLLIGSGAVVFFVGLAFVLDKIIFRAGIPANKANEQDASTTPQSTET
jgi:DHA3 family macrolide efflux protein-like MFS transporter